MKDCMELVDDVIHDTYGMRLPKEKSMGKEHTPGPWRSNSDHKIYGSGIQNCYDGVTCFVASVGGSVADVRLIEAAPDMLEMLKDCLAFVAEIKDHGIREWSGEGKLRAVLAKATERRDKC